MVEFAFKFQAIQKGKSKSWSSHLQTPKTLQGTPGASTAPARASCHPAKPSYRDRQRNATCWCLGPSKYVQEKTFSTGRHLPIELRCLEPWAAAEWGYGGSAAGTRAFQSPLCPCVGLGQILAACPRSLRHWHTDVPRLLYQPSLHPARIGDIPLSWLVLGHRCHPAQRRLPPWRFSRLPGQGLGQPHLALVLAITADLQGSFPN